MIFINVNELPVVDRSTGRGVLQCSECTDNLPDTSPGEYSVICMTCGEEQYETGDNHILAVEADAHLLADDKAVEEYTFYHATSRQNWEVDIFNAGVSVHVGSIEAALSRIEDIRLTSENYLDGDDIHLYEIKVSAESMLDRVIRDETYWADSLDAFLDWTDGRKVVRYINTWENPGSLSLILDPSAMTIVNHRVIALEN